MVLIAVVIQDLVVLLYMHDFRVSILAEGTSESSAVNIRGQKHRFQIEIN